MWRLIFITFAFLGLLFYELSGGADYKPSTQSIQARDKIADVRPVARPVQVRVMRVSSQGDTQYEPVTRSLTSLASLAIAEGDRFEITLASAGNTANVTAGQEPTPQPKLVSVPTVAADSAKISTIVEPTPLEATPKKIVDVRKVVGQVVNMRSGPGTQYNRISKLRKGAEVTVLRAHDNGWIKLRSHDTGKVGWMSARLLSTATN